jgi:hypothetical protein
MKTFMLFFTSSMVITSGAFAQGNSDACHNQYGMCVERCAKQPESMQEKCSQSCESSTNQCYGVMYGGATSQGAQMPDKASNPLAEARDEATANTSKKKRRAQPQH